MLMGPIEDNREIFSFYRRKLLTKKERLVGNFKEVKGIWDSVLKGY